MWPLRGSKAHWDFGMSLGLVGQVASMMLPLLFLVYKGEQGF